MDTVTFTFGLVFDCAFSYFIAHHSIPKGIISTEPQISYTHGDRRNFSSSHTQNAIQIMMAQLHKAILVYTAQQLHCEVQSLLYIAH